MSKWRERLARFMAGRYGANDTLNKWLFGAFFVLIVLSFILSCFNAYIYSVLEVLSIVVLVYACFRMFSRNIPKRVAENERFIRFKSNVTPWFRKRKERLKTLRKYHIYRCPQCKQKIRIPRGRGKICITCPKCHTEFTKRS